MNTNLDSWLERFPDYPLRPCMFNLRSDKIIHFNLGLSSNYNGYWDSSIYGGKDGDYSKWMEIYWDIKDEPDCKLYFGVYVLSHIGKYPDKHTFPNPLKADAFWLTINDFSQPNNHGWGKEHVIKVVYSVDDVFKWISEHHILSPFFFTEKEKKNMVFHEYKDR